MACGTPVIAFPCGSVPEVIDHGVSGFIVDSVDDAVRMVAKLPDLDRATVRATFDARFTSSRMAADYLEVYRRQLDDNTISVPLEVVSSTMGMTPRSQ